MKKILSTVAAFGLVAGVASTAAAVGFSVSGRYVVGGYYKNHGGQYGVNLQEGNGVGEKGNSDAYFLHSFKLAPVLTVNDKIKMVTDIWVADNTFWGAGQDAEGTQGGPGVNSNNVEFWQYYLDYMSPLGEVRVGRQLGANTLFGTSFLDTLTHSDGIEWSPSFLARGPWSTRFVYEKNIEGDGGLYNNNGVSDQDKDYYEVSVSHKGGEGLGEARVGFTNDKSVATQDTREYRLSASGQYNLPLFYINSEIDYRTGKTEYDSGAADTDVSKLAAFLQVGKKIGALDVSAMYIYASGDSSNNGNDTAAATDDGLGNEFEPYYILTGSNAGIFNTELFDRTPAAGDIRYDARQAGLHSIGVHANYAVSDRLMLHGAVAYSRAASEQAGYDSDYGVEYDIGGAYKLLSNLTYEVHFGYLDTGDFFKGFNGTKDTQNVYLVSNHLTMTF